jgi:decaprenylphospho-beta-D-erythro-pentofuranosid-2-ulose 2-reductase
VSTQRAKRILIIGATSAIAEATARLWAADGAQFYLLARDSEKLLSVSRDLEIRGARVMTACLDVNHFDAHAAAIDAAFRSLNHVDVVLMAHGDLPNQAACEESVEAALTALSTNAVSAVSLLTLIANRLQVQRGAVIAVIGSVAGDRGRKSNYVYASAKALVAAFVEGLAGRLLAADVRVLNIKPGFVDTPMTAQLKKGMLFVRADIVAKIIHQRAASAPSGSYYAPRFWWWIMLIIRSLPARILYRLNI